MLPRRRRGNESQIATFTAARFAVAFANKCFPVGDEVTSLKSLPSWPRKICGGIREQMLPRRRRGNESQIVTFTAARFAVALASRCFRLGASLCHETFQLANGLESALNMRSGSLWERILPGSCPADYATPCQCPRDFLIMRNFQ
jgi:hypothetical protein